MNYKIVCDTEELNKFIKFLPSLKDNETYYCSLLARDKYVRELGVGSFGSDKHQCARWVTHDIQRLPVKLKQLECPIGSYALRGIEVPQEALATYITVNPRCQIKATKKMLHKMADILTENNPVKVNVYQESLTAIHQSISRKVFVDLDFDGVDAGDTVRQVLEYVNKEAVDVVLTRGGIHVLITLSEIAPEYVKSWYKNMLTIPGIDIVGDTMLPVPGTYQGGWIPKMVDVEYFKDR